MPWRCVRWVECRWFGPEGPMGRQCLPRELFPELPAGLWVRHLWSATESHFRFDVWKRTENTMYLKRGTHSPDPWIRWWGQGSQQQKIKEVQERALLKSTTSLAELNESWQGCTNECQYTVSDMFWYLCDMHLPEPGCYQHRWTFRLTHWDDHFLGPHS